jgi:predicted nucleotide-binding protein
MSAARRSFESRAETYLEQARLFHEPQLAEQGLSEAQIKSQTLEQLRESLEKLETFIAHPGQFGLFRIKLTAEGSSIIVQDRAEAQIEIGILPLLLVRKQLVLNRIKELGGGRTIRNLQEWVQQVPDQATRERLSSELQDLTRHTEDLARQAQAAAQEATRLRERDLQELRDQMARAATGIFIVHGHDEALKFEVARLLENATEEAVTILAEQPNRGRTVVEKLEQYSQVKFAVVLLTPDDKVVSSDEELPRGRARQNVILELGLFLGLLGRDRVCALHKKAVEIPSDYGGVLFVEADARGAWKLDLLRELEAVGIAVDWRRAR